MSNEGERYLDLAGVLMIGSLLCEIYFCNEIWQKYCEYLMEIAYDIKDYKNQSKRKPHPEYILNFRECIEKVLKQYPEQTEFLWKVFDYPETLMNNKNLLKKFILFCKRYNIDNNIKRTEEDKKQANKSLFFIMDMMQKLYRGHQDTNFMKYI